MKKSWLFTFVLVVIVLLRWSDQVLAEQKSSHQESLETNINHHIDILEKQYWARQQQQKQQQEREEGKASAAAAGAEEDVGPSILVVSAHADDDTSYSGLLYAVTKNLKGTVDLVVVTDGQGGYSCSTAAEWYYKLRLTDPKIGRQNLPRIRMSEMLAGAEVVGARYVWFLFEPDVEYTTNITVVLDSWWDVPLVKYQLKKILTQHQYDFVLMILPSADQHGEHSAASVLTLEVVSELPAAQRPVCLGGSNPGPWAGMLPGFPITSAPQNPSFSFNRSQPVGPRVDYTVIASQVIAKHVSQGCLQLTLDDPPQLIEWYYYFDLNPPDLFAKTQSFFNALASIPFIEFVTCF